MRGGGRATAALLPAHFARSVPTRQPATPRRPEAAIALSLPILLGPAGIPRADRGGRVDGEDMAARLLTTAPMAHPSRGAPSTRHARPKRAEVAYYAAGSLLLVAVAWALTRPGRLPNGRGLPVSACRADACVARCMQRSGAKPRRAGPTSAVTRGQSSAYRGPPAGAYNPPPLHTKPRSFHPGLGTAVSSAVAAYLPL